MSMSTRLYPLSGEDDDESKVWYTLSLGMETGMEMYFFYRD